MPRESRSLTNSIAGFGRVWAKASAILFCGHLCVALVISYASAGVFSMPVARLLAIAAVVSLQGAVVAALVAAARRGSGGADDDGAPNILISAGEVSGDMAGAAIASELRRRDPACRVWGLGGARMTAAGVEVVSATNQLGRIGVSESFSAIVPFLRAFAEVRREVRRSRPRVAVLIANDVFNWVLGLWLRWRGVPTLAVFPPQIWIWRAILGVFCRAYDAVAASFPEEVRHYAKHAPTRFVGHHLADELSAATHAERAAARASLGAASADTVIGLLPGSRQYEIELLLPLLLDVAGSLRDGGAVRFAMAYAEDAHRDAFAQEIARRDMASCVTLVPDSRTVMRASDLLLMASGTATLEASLIGTPMIAMYRVFPLTIFIVRLAIRLGLMPAETMALPNLLAGREIVPEIRQEILDAGRVAAEAAGLLADRARLAAMREEVLRIRPLVDGGGSAAAIADVIEGLARGDTGEHVRMPHMMLEGESG